jgi:hypothetical protein
VTNLALSVEARYVEVVDEALTKARKASFTMSAPHLRAIRRGIANRKQRERAVVADADAWDRACNEITASILSDEVIQFGDTQHEASLVLRHVRDRLDEAKVELGVHPLDATDCQCRHHALIAVGAKFMMRQTGVYPTSYCDSMRVLLDAYPARRS